MYLKLLLLFLIIISLAAVLLFFFFYPRGKDWAKIQGYKDALDKCKSLCEEYQESNCDKLYEKGFCFALFSLDLNENNIIDPTASGTTPSGYLACENAVGCFNLIECKCREKTLNFKECLSVMCDEFINLGFNRSDASDTIFQKLFKGCSIPYKEIC